MKSEPAAPAEASMNVWSAGLAIAAWAWTALPATARASPSGTGGEGGGLNGTIEQHRGGGIK